MSKKKAAILVPLLLALPALPRAAPAFPTVERVYLTAEETGSPQRGPASGQPLPAAGQVTIDRIVNTAQNAWPVVEKNYPVSDSRINFANAVPDGISDWTQLAGWQEPKAYLLTYTAENPYGMKMVTLSYRLVYTYGGSYGGKGCYLGAVSVELEKVDVAPGYHLRAEAAVPEATVVNAGTHEEPVAALQFKMSYKISTAVSAWGGSTIFYIDGTGAVWEMGGPGADEKLAAVAAGRQLLDLKAKIRRE